MFLHELRNSAERFWKPGGSGDQAADELGYTNVGHSICVHPSSTSTLIVLSNDVHASTAALTIAARGSFCKTVRRHFGGGHGQRFRFLVVVASAVSLGAGRIRARRRSDRLPGRDRDAC